MHRKVAFEVGFERSISDGHSERHNREREMAELSFGQLCVVKLVEQMSWAELDWSYPVTSCYLPVSPHVALFAFLSHA